MQRTFPLKGGEKQRAPESRCIGGSWPPHIVRIKTPPDGNCQFSAVSRALREAGHNAFLSTNTSVTMKSLRRFVAQKITPSDVSEVLKTYGTIPSCTWLRDVVNEPNVEADEILARVRSIVESSKPVLYQGDDWSLGIMSRELSLRFIIVRNDDTLQGGLPSLEENIQHIIVLYFVDMDPNAAPTGATNGHYDLLAHVLPDGSEKTVFTAQTLPKCILEKLKRHKPHEYAALLRTTPQPDAPACKESTKPDAPPSPCKPSPGDLLFPMQTTRDCAGTITSARLYSLVFLSIETMSRRMNYYASLIPHDARRSRSFTQHYAMDFSDMEASMRVELHESDVGLETYTLCVEIDDYLSDSKTLNAVCPNAQCVCAWLESEDVFTFAKKPALISVTAKTSLPKPDATFPIALMDAHLIIPGS
jgi:hypothetical protein